MVAFDLMPFYVLDKCPEDVLDDIGALCERIGLREHQGVQDLTSPDLRQWGDFDHTVYSTVTYDPDREGMELYVQTSGNVDAYDPGVIAVVSELVAITGATRVLNYFDTSIAEEYDMGLFRGTNLFSGCFFLSFE